MNEFQKQYMCNFQQSPREVLLFNIAEQYATSAEEYDRTVCTGPVINHEVMPATPREQFLSIQNARSAFDRLCANYPQFSRQELRRAISKADRRARPQ
ncbi:hypothetical protein SAMN05216264_101581 [Pseudomonas marincola]|nr:hypothetical protein SAMN05216264_101581 [Pseudomonas marincola]